MSLQNFAQPTSETSMLQLDTAQAFAGIDEIDHARQQYGSKYFQIAKIPHARFFIMASAILPSPISMG